MECLFDRTFLPRGPCAGNVHRFRPPAPCRAYVLESAGQHEISLTRTDTRRLNRITGERGAPENHLVMKPFVEVSATACFGHEDDFLESSYDRRKSSPVVDEDGGNASAASKLDKVRLNIPQVGQRRPLRCFVVVLSPPRFNCS
ncbi:hypothetical protein TcWFU_000466 [Taenia crassiceps]|uniref:Uncharacterized protein n=1 Tax=Taenia crassiceps TaxID=6207 RepID=A0ABR4Q7S1_9CEST